MSDHALGPGWWQASDGKWYPPQGQAPPLDEDGLGEVLEDVSVALSGRQHDLPCTS